MAVIHNLGFPRIGKHRELKFALEQYWAEQLDQTSLFAKATKLREEHWRLQSDLTMQTVGDFSFYDQVLDTSELVGNIPPRFQQENSISGLDNYFLVARGRSTSSSPSSHASEMTKWFDTNYHYIVPEFDCNTQFSLHAENLLQQIKEAKSLGYKIKPVMIGPVSYLWLGKSKDSTNKLELLESLLPVYLELLNQLHAENIEWVQIDEPALVMNLSREWINAYEHAYFVLKSALPKILLTTYFGPLKGNLRLACELPIDGLHIDAINAKQEVEQIIDWLPQHKVLSLGVIDGRNIWKSDLNQLLDWLEPLFEKRKDKLWLAPSCSLLHVPIELKDETKIDPEISSWMAFAIEKIQELNILSLALTKGREYVKDALTTNRVAIDNRKNSNKAHNPDLQQRLNEISDDMTKRKSSHKQRAALHKQRLNLPLFPTTTIGSFPQTSEIRKTRNDYRSGEITRTAYEKFIQDTIEYLIREQEAYDLDVLVHGEPERNDMVEYFSEHLEGCLSTQAGWVQSYGSRCVKPPIIYGDIERPKAMTVDWINYAQSLTDKPVKGMLTGPTTILNWSFVRDDQPLADTCIQLALAIRDEVLDLEKSGINIIQIDEAALREGLPLRKEDWEDYLSWAIKSFRLAANGVSDETQIHTHMCYSEFNDIIHAIADMDADVITIENSRSDMELLEAFVDFDYPNQIGPGVYDIHSPNVPEIQNIIDSMKKATQHIPIENLWLNPDCGLKTRSWEEVKPALMNMVEAGKQLRSAHGQS